MPALRERLEDVPVLASTILQRLARQTGKTFDPLSDDVCKRLCGYAWPGNVRQLENMLRWMTAMLVGTSISTSIIDDAIAQFDDTFEGRHSVNETVADNVDDTQAITPLWLVEKRAIQQAIDASDGNINRAAALLEVAPSTIYRKMQTWKNSGA